MKVFCPNCGSENDGLTGGRVTCRACTATFEVPAERLSAQVEAPVRPVVAAPGPQPQYVQPLAVQQVNSNAPTNTLAIVSLVTSLICCAPVAFITGIIGLQQVKASNGAQKGKELAIIGIVLGALGTCSGVFYALAIAISANS